MDEEAAYWFTEFERKKDLTTTLHQFGAVFTLGKQNAEASTSSSCFQISTNHIACTLIFLF